jgi:hypothetical protein
MIYLHGSHPMSGIIKIKGRGGKEKKEKGKKGKRKKRKKKRKKKNHATFILSGM